MTLKPAFKYMDVDVQIDDYEFKFHVHELDDREFASARDAKDAIEKVKTRKAKSVKLALTIVDDKGRESIITGIHASNGNKLVQPKNEERNPNYYPRQPVCIEGIKLKIALERKLRRVNSALNKFRLEHDPYSGHNFDMERRQKEVMDDFNSKNVAAAKTTWDIEMEAVKNGDARVIEV
jgi:hypothetical protein